MSQIWLFRLVLTSVSRTSHGKSGDCLTHLHSIECDCLTGFVSAKGIYVAFSTCCCNLQVQRTASSLAEIQKAHSVFVAGASGLCMVSSDASWRIIYSVLRKLMDLALDFQDLAQCLQVWWANPHLMTKTLHVSLCHPGPIPAIGSPSCQESQ